jgi:RNA polymerase sigma factor (sigma-70 family)
MNCQQITQTMVALEILQTPGDNRLQSLYHCIYSLYLDSFLGWILQRYTGHTQKDKLLEDAKDAFQNGILAFYIKASKEGFSIKGSIKTKIFSFGLLQLWASYKKDKHDYGARDYLNNPDLHLADTLLENEELGLLNEREQDLLEALTKLPEKQQKILSMKFFDKLKSKQIAEKLGVSAGYIDNESAKAYKTLRRMLKVKLSGKWS